jgi:SAM-dependent methyltransferase
VAEFGEGQRVLQAACVYGPFSRMLADCVGPTGALEVVDVAALQVDNVRRKLRHLEHVQVRQADLTDAGCIERGASDAVCCFFLLHEVPDGERRSIVDNLLGAVRPGGKIVFVDYHRTVAWHPLRPIMALVFRWLEPYALSLLDTDIASLSECAADFEWKKTTCFGGLYQKLVGVRRG